MISVTNGDDLPTWMINLLNSSPATRWPSSSAPDQVREAGEPATIGPPHGQGVSIWSRATTERADPKPSRGMSPWAAG